MTPIETPEHHEQEPHHEEPVHHPTPKPAVPPHENTPETHPETPQPKGPNYKLRITPLPGMFLV